MSATRPMSTSTPMSPIGAMKPMASTRPPSPKAPTAPKAQIAPGHTRRSLLLALTAGALQACASRPAPEATMPAAKPDAGPMSTPAAPAARGPAPTPATPDPSPYSLSRPVGPTIADQDSTHYRFERFNVDSVDGRRHYRIQLAIPRAAPPPAGYPLLVMLDGNAAFAALTTEQLGGLAQRGQPLLIAALGHETPLGADSVARAFDYTPPVPGEHPTWDDPVRQRVGGGAAIFLDLFEARIRPALLQRAPVDPARSTLWGHSYGGLLTLYTLFTRPALFARYAAADPSLWWHEGFILDLETRALPLPAGGAQLLLMAGSAAADGQAETRPLRPGLDPAVVQAARSRRLAVPPDATERLAERQARRTGLGVSWQPFPGVAHGPMRGASIPPTLALAAR